MSISIYQFKQPEKDCNTDEYVSVFIGIKPSQETFNKFYFKMCDVVVNHSALKTDDNLDLCEELFKFFNSPDRPNGSFYRSMCINDVIKIDDKMYICGSWGFSECCYDLSSIPVGDNCKTYTI